MRSTAQRIEHWKRATTASSARRPIVAMLAVTLVVLGGSCAIVRRPPPPTGGVWKPKPGTTWQWQITGSVNTSVSPAAMYDIDMQDAMPSARSVSVPGFGTVNWAKGDNAGVIATLHRLGKVVVCYMDSGAWESYRPDAALFPRSVIGNTTGWNGENWLDIRPASRVRFAPLIWSRMDVARSIGCDGIEPDQNNPIGNNPGFPITTVDQTSWYLQVAAEAHARHLSVGMKNGMESVNAATVNAFDWALNEECFQYNECGTLLPFVRAGKAVFQTEYQGNPASFCPVARQDGFSSMLKDLNLDAWRVACF
jgi:hypothetical protein